MSAHRRRPRGEHLPATKTHDDTVESSGQNTPREQTPDQHGAEDYKLVHKKHLLGLKKKTHVKGTKRRTAWIFILGGLFGLLMAAFFANHNELLDLAALADIDFQPLMDVLPAGFLSEAKEFQVCSISECADQSLLNLCLNVY